jgi:hypothetical protein
MMEFEEFKNSIARLQSKNTPAARGRLAFAADTST